LTLDERVDELVHQRVDGLNDSPLLTARKLSDAFERPLHLADGAGVFEVLPMFTLATLLNARFG